MNVCRYTETVVRKDLVRVVESGPFKQYLDLGLDARKVRVHISRKDRQRWSLFSFVVVVVVWFLFRLFC